MIFHFHSDPNGPGLVHWPQYGNPRSVQILDIPLTTEDNLLPERRKFWLEVVPNILNGKTTNGGGSHDTTGAGCKMDGIGILHVIILCVMFILFELWFHNSGLDIILVGM